MYRGSKTSVWGSLESTTYELDRILTVLEKLTVRNLMEKNHLASFAEVVCVPDTGTEATVRASKVNSIPKEEPVHVALGMLLRLVSSQVASLIVGRMSMWVKRGYFPMPLMYWSCSSSIILITVR